MNNNSTGKRIIPRCWAYCDLDFVDIRLNHEVPTDSPLVKFH